MRQVIAAVLEQDLEACTQALLELGVIDFIDIREIPAQWTAQLDSVPAGAEAERAGELRKRLEAYFHSAGVPLSELTKNAEVPREAPDLRKIDSALDGLETEIKQVREGQKEVQDQILQLQELQRQLPVSRDPSPAFFEQEHPYVEIFAGTLAPEKRRDFEEALSGISALHLPQKERDLDYLLCLKQDAPKMERLLRRFGWQEVSPKELEASGAWRKVRERDQELPPQEKIDEKLSDLRKKQDELKEQLQRSFEKRLELFAPMWAGLRAAELTAQVKEHYRKTEKTYIFSGWIPADKQRELTAALRGASEGRAYLEWHRPEEKEDTELARDVPVQMKNPKIFSPFQALVQNFGTPVYGSVDPTPLVALFYLMMFGLMFGDAGHGLVVLLVGLFGSRRQRRRGRKNTLFPLISWCGASAIVFGFLFGSFFGLPILKPLWFDYHAVVLGHGTAGSVRSITDILLITIYFGILVISTGLLLNWFNRLRQGDWIQLIWGNGGLLVGWLYAGGTYSAFYFVGREYRHLPPQWLLTVLLLVPALLLLLKEPLTHYMHGREGKERGKIAPFTVLMEWAVELLEIFSGYLSNTLSFMRVAGLGIAHVSLMTAFFQIADMAAGEGSYGIGSYLILLLGNALVIGLEGLSAGIQSLRLNYYEFFSKYFVGNGRAYTPISFYAGDSKESSA